MVTVSEFFDFVADNGILGDCPMYISDWNGQIHRIGSLSSSDLDPAGDYPGHLTLISEELYCSQIYTPATIWQFTHEDCIYSPDAPITAELYKPGEKYDIDGLAIGAPPDNDYTYIVFEE